MNERRSEPAFSGSSTSVCSRDALKLSFGFDMGGRELLRERKTEV